MNMHFYFFCVIELKKDLKNTEDVVDYFKHTQLKIQKVQT